MAFPVIYDPQIFPPPDLGGGVPGGGTVTSVGATPPINVTPNPITGSGLVGHDPSGVTAATYGDASNIPQIAVNATGHVTGIANVSIGGPFQSSLSGKQVRFAQWNMQTPNQYGFAFANASLAPVAPASTNVLTSLGYTEYQTTNGLSDLSINANSNERAFWFGNGTGLGGFLVTFVFGLTAVDGDMPSFFGLTNTASNIATSSAGWTPSALLNCVFMGADRTDTNFQIMNNDGSGTCSKINLGSNFPARTANTCFRLTFTAAVNSTAFTYLVERLDLLTSSGILSSTGTVSTNIPGNTTFMLPQCGITNGSSAANCKFAMVRIYAETNY